MIVQRYSGGEQESGCMRALYQLLSILALPGVSFACTWDVVLTDNETHETRHFAPNDKPFYLPVPKLADGSCRISQIRSIVTSRTVNVTCGVADLVKGSYSSTVTAISSKGSPSLLTMDVSSTPAGQTKVSPGYSIEVICK